MIKLCAEDILKRLDAIKPEDRIITEADRFGRSNLIDKPELRSSIDASVETLLGQRRALRFQFLKRSLDGRQYLCELVVGTDPSTVTRLMKALDRVTVENLVARNRINILKAKLTD